MTAHEKTEITIETDQILIIRRRRSVRFWCQECGSPVDMVGSSSRRRTGRELSLLLCLELQQTVGIGLCDPHIRPIKSDSRGLDLPRRHLYPVAGAQNPHVEIT